jgi:hypothetical protein
MLRRQATATIAILIVGLALAAGCESASGAGKNDPGQTDADADSDTDTDADADADSDADGDTDEELIPDCSACPGVGTTLDHLRCAIDLCDDDVLLSHEYASLTATNQTKIARSRAGVTRFGDAGNALAPLLGDSYALMASGFAVPSSPPDNYDHNQILSGTLLQPDGPGVTDPFAPSEVYKAYDVMEWRLHLEAPATAHGFRVHYVFFSVEYDEYVGNAFNDKFYVFLEAPSTNGGQRTVINFTECRPGIAQPDFTCPAGHPWCEEGEEYCYIAINSALSECCWYDGCTTMDQNTDISGTGFECGTHDVDYVGDYSMGFTYGSSTGWLYTEWPVEPGEEFDLIFHIHDTADAILDSEVILDKFVFLQSADAGTGPVVE